MPPPNPPNPHYTPHVGRPSELARAMTLLDSLSSPQPASSLSAGAGTSVTSEGRGRDANNTFYNALPGDIREELEVSYENSRLHREDMSSWAPLQEDFLLELHRLDGLGNDSTVVCGDPACPDRKASRTPNAPSRFFRCDDCTHGRLVCTVCCVREHRSNLLHRIKTWNGIFFAETSLHLLDLSLELGHDGNRCPLPTNQTTEMTVLHINGLHTLRVKICTCPDAAPLWTQLLRARLYPATITNPRTCATLQYLRQSHLLKFEAHVATGALFSTLLRVTDNAEVYEHKSRYKALLTMLRQWRLLKLHKRAGRAYDGGVSSTSPGELALICPACPHPGVNLPKNWNSPNHPAPYIYRPIYAADANFRLKSRSRTSNTQGLVTGLAYFVPEEHYRSYLSTHGQQSEMSNCSGLAAVDHANTRNSHGLRATGVGALVCARHGCWLPVGVGDLQKGERYCNMDYIIFSAISNLSDTKQPFPEILLSYDIMCQYSRNLSSRLDDNRFPESFRTESTIRGVIPKFHADAHKEECRTTYSLNLEWGAGRTDGEQVERNWAHSNGAANSTKEMTSGSRRDTLDDTFGDWNFTIIKGLGSALHRRRQSAVEAAKKHEAFFNELDSSISDTHRANWRDLISQYQAHKFEPNQFNPFVKAVSNHPTVQQVKLALLEAEEKFEGLPIFGGQTFASFLATGLEIESAQQDLLFKISELKKTITGRQEFNLAEARLSLDRRIQKFRQSQVVFMPYFTIPSTPGAQQPEQVNLYLPSAVVSLISGPNSTPGSNAPSADESILSPITQQKAEAQLRIALSHSFLDDLRRHLLVRANYFKSGKEARGQSAHTRLHDLLSKTDRRVEKAKSKYRHNRTAFRLLRAGSDEIRLLTDNDARDLTQPLSGSRREHVSEGNRSDGWIWRSQLGDLDSDPEMHEAVRIEWAWAYERKERWREELLIINEEMQRFLVTCQVQFERWIARSQNISNITAQRPDLTSGLRAYAVRQAFILSRRAQKNRGLWDYRADELKWIPPHFSTPSNIMETVGQFADENATDSYLTEVADEEAEANYDSD